MFGNFHRLFFTRYVSLLALKFNLLLYGKLKVDVQICLHESSGELGFEKIPQKSMFENYHFRSIVPKNVR